MKEKELSHQESFQVIQEMIEVAKNRMTDTGFHFLLWGALVIAASITQYFMISMGMAKDSDLVWIIMPIIGVPAALIYEYRRKKTEKTHSKSDKMYGYLWLGFGITLFLSIYISVSFSINPIAFILLLVGFATFVSGAIYRFTPLIIGSFVFWLAAALCPHMESQNQLLINALAIFMGYIIPGILLWRKYNKVNHV
ncbi:MAG: hypothetical protein WC341_17240 [Bacteroidales bacterium]|jgi:NAD/NADP transhydrogenase beta subunit